MARRHALYYPQRINLRVPAKAYTANVEGAGIIFASYGAPAAANNTLLFNAQSVAAAGTFVVADPAAQTEAAMGRYGRGLRLVAAGAYSGVIIVRGRDYLGQPMREDITANGTTPVLGVKAFRYVDSINIATTAATTVSLGVTDLMGLPEKMLTTQGLIEVKNGTTTANAGTFVVGLANATTPTATNADPRGTYLPVTVIPNGTNTFELRYVADTNNLHGNAHFFA
jgi:hypothetical protein